MNNVNLYIASTIGSYLLIFILLGVSFVYDWKKHKNIKLTNKDYLLKFAVSCNLIAIYVVLNLFLKIVIIPNILTLRFSQIPLIIMAVLYGPLWGSITALIANNLAYLFAPNGFYFAGYVLTDVWITFIFGFIFSLDIFKKIAKNNFYKYFFISMIIGFFLTTLTINFGLNYLWAYLNAVIFYDIDVFTMPIFISKIITALIAIPIIYVISSVILITAKRSKILIPNNLSRYDENI